MITEADMLAEHYYGLSDWEIAVLMAVDDQPISRQRLHHVLNLYAQVSEEGSE